ncbi:MRG family protein, putative isoform 5, partial [Theobroma cacao]
MGSSNTALNDDDDSATESDNDTATKTDSDSDTDSETETDEEFRKRYDTGPFREGEKVLAFHNLRIYEAKVLKFDNRSNGWHYFVHYLEEKSAVPSEKIVSIQLPLTLRKQLVNDCEFITHLGKLVKLPRIPTVEDILKMYLDYRSKKDGTVTDSVQEIFKGIRVYFNKALPVMLLYKSERQQYDDTITEDICPSTVYGAEHLLRLFVKLPELLVRADIEEETLLELQQKLVDFLKFLQKNQNT